MKEKDRLDALEVALNNEKNEREFYLVQAGRTKSSVGKAMFQQIADDELEHYERLQQLHEKWKQNEKWPETVPLLVNDTNVKDILKDKVAQAEAQPRKDTDDLKALEIAIEFEGKGVKFYSQLAEASSAANEKDFFNLLSRIEREHYLSLKDVHEYLTDPSAYFIEKERHGMDGA